MNQEIDNIENVDDNLQDEWLSQSLKSIQIDPPKDFTSNVIEQVEIKPNPLNNSPLFWILAVIPAVFLIWILFPLLGSLDHNFSANHNIPNITSIISIYLLSKYVLMVVIGGLFFIGLDYFLSKQLSHKKSFFSFMLV